MRDTARASSVWLENLESIDVPQTVGSSVGGFWMETGRLSVDSSTRYVAHCRRGHCVWSKCLSSNKSGVSLISSASHCEGLFCTDFWSSIMMETICWPQSSSTTNWPKFRIPTQHQLQCGNGPNFAKCSTTTLRPGSGFLFIKLKLGDPQITYQ